MKKNISLFVGPLLFIICLLLPESFLSFAVRGAIGTFLWMTVWWIRTPVNISVTAFLPIITNAWFGFVPMSVILPKYAADLVMLLIGAGIITVTWEATGLNERIAVTALSIIGPHVKQQVAVWFGVSVVISIFLPNVVVAAALCPIAVAMLQHVGIEDVKKSRAATNILLAIGWGAGIGGFGSPIGGGQNLVTIDAVEKITGHEFMYIDYVGKMMPMLLAVTVALSIFMICLKNEVKTLPGSREYFTEERKKLGKMSHGEIVSAILFLISLVLAFGRPLYGKFLPSFKPAFAFLMMGLVAFVLPGDVDGRLITWKYAQPKINWGIFYMLAGGLALGSFIIESGTANILGDILYKLNMSGGFTTVALLTFMGMLLSNVSSNTAACSIALPIVVSLTNALGLNPLPYIYITTVASNCAYLLPTSTRALSVSYGVKTDYMMKYGIFAVLITFVVVVTLGMIFLKFWPFYSV